MIINGRDNSLYSLNKFKKTRKKEKLFTCFQLLPSQKVYGLKCHFFKCWLKVNKRFYKCLNIEKRSYDWFSMKMSNYLDFLFWHQNGSWPPPPSPLIYPRICQTFLRPPLPHAVWRHMWTIPKTLIDKSNNYVIDIIITWAVSAKMPSIISSNQLVFSKDSNFSLVLIDKTPLLMHPPHKGFIEADTN